MDGEQKMAVYISIVIAVPLTFLAIFLNWPMSDAAVSSQAAIIESKANIVESMSSNGYSSDEISEVLSTFDEYSGVKIDISSSPSEEEVK